MEKSTRIGFTILAVIVVAGLFTMGKGINSSVVAIDAQGAVGVSGKLIALDPNRPMAGSPCHTMGGQAMGDCDTREVNIEAKQWDWSEPTITVKSGEKVKIMATSKDVTHGFSIPKLGFNIRIDPGRTSVGEFIAPEPGEYSFGCSVNCGAGHGSHKGKLVVL